MQNVSWSPTRPPSRGANAYHDAVANSSWHKQNIAELIKIIKNKIKPNDVIIDFGAGTGSSAIYILKHIKNSTKLFLVDNSPSWLGKAYELLHKYNNVSFFLLEKKENGHMTLNEIAGKEKIDHVVSANTVHLIPTIKETFKGIYESLKNGGTFIFQSGNILLPNKKPGIMMIDDSINEVHDLAIEINRNDKLYVTYRKNLEKRIQQEIIQRKFVFPTPRPISFYLDILRSVGFKKINVKHIPIKVKYKDWLNFLRVRRLQAGILPEIGGKDASEQEEKDRDVIITKATGEFFKKLKRKNPLANATSFIAEWTYATAEK